MLKRRTWGRGIYTQYTYTAGGKPAMVNYSDTTPDVTYAYDRMGRVTTLTDGIGIRSIAFNGLGQPLSEDFTAGILDPVKIENTYDTMGRRTQNTLLVNTQQRNAVAFGYEDLTGRLSTVTKNTTRRARYAYTPGAPGQVQAVVHESLASNAWQATDTGTRVYDGFERLTSIGWTTGTGNNQATVASFAYLYNTANERTRTTLADGSYWQYVYDDLGQVSSGKRYSSTGAPIPGQQFEYTFDDIGNRTQAKAGGDASGNNLRTANYTSNLLNMYTGRGSPGSVDIMGYAPLASYPVSITTGGSTVPVDFRLLEYYQKKLSWTNSAAARFEQVLAESDPTHAGSEKELWVFLPKDPEAFTHDVDGNLLQDGRWNYGWDGENRLIWMESRTDLPTAMPRQRVEFGYDFMSRRNVKRMYIPVVVAEIPGGPLGEPETIGATTSVIDGATASVAGPGSDAAPETLPAWAVSAPVGWTQVGLSKYVWDGWNLLAELDIMDASVRTFAWGMDLSGSEQGAGGIGGLVLGWTRANGTLGGEVNGTGGNTLRYVFDGNGNVMAALDDLGRVRAKYEYGPFGETLTSEGDLAADNPIRWSTKYTDGESGLVYYGYRYYNAGTGRWLGRDPMSEKGSANLACFVKNDPTGRVDLLGLCCFEPPESSPRPDRDNPDSWWRQSSHDPELYPKRYRFLGSFCEAAAFASTFLENVTPEIEVKFGFYKSIKKTQTCCKDGTIHECTSKGFELIFGAELAVSASYTIETEFSTSESDDKCPLEGRYHKIQAGVSGELRHVAGGSIKFKGGGVIYPNGEFWKLGQAEISLSLPGGIGCSTGVETDDQRALAIVASIQATLLEEGGGFNVGSYSTWTVTCKDTRKACPCAVSKTPSTN